AEAEVAERVRLLGPGELRDRAGGERDVDPGRVQPWLADPGPQPLRAVGADEREHVVHRRQARREGAQPRPRAARVAELEEEEVLVVLVEAGDAVALHVVAELARVDRLVRLPRAGVAAQRRHE